MLRHYYLGILQRWFVRRLPLKDDEKHHAEEVRLLYVGMTRAREKLLVTSSKANFYTERLLGVVFISYYL